MCARVITRLGQIHNPPICQSAIRGKSEILQFEALYHPIGYGSLICMAIWKAIGYAHS